jgi:cell cycle checkpoint protein
MSERFAGGSHVGTFIYLLLFLFLFLSIHCDLYVNRANLRIGVDDDDVDVDDNDYGYRRHGPMDQEALFTKFQAFLTRASSCQSIFSPSPAVQLPTPSSSSSQSPSQPTPTKPPKHILTPSPKRHIILLEDLPNILHPHTQSQFHAALQGLVDSPAVDIVPVVIIVSDAGVRGEVGDDERIAGGRWGKEVVDIRSVLPAGLLGSAYVTQIGYVYK